MADEGSADQLLPAFWSLSPSSHPGSGSRARARPEPDQNHHHQGPQFLALSLFDRPDAAMDAADHLALSLRPGPGLWFHDRQHQQDTINGDCWAGDEFFIGRRSSSLSGSGSESESNSEFARARPVDRDGMRISGFESDDSDSDEQIVAIGDDSISTDRIQVIEDMSSPGLNLNVPLCWDCLRIDEDGRDFNEEFEWEEIDGRLEEREVIGFNQEEDQEAEEAAGNVEWEVLLTNIGNGDDAESFFDEGFVYTNSDYDEVTFAQFQEHHDTALKGSPPAAKSAVESLPSFVLSKEDVENDCSSIGCAVCKDEISVGEKAKRLPCAHCYHEGCILPWLEVRNTCPLCRHELPTDDPEYESWKARREVDANVGGLETAVDDTVRYDFEMLPEAY